LIFYYIFLTKLSLFKFVFHIQLYLKLFSNFKFIYFELLHKLVKIIFKIYLIIIIIFTPTQIFV